MGTCAIYFSFGMGGGVSICSDFQRREGGRGFDRFLGNSKGVRSNPSNPPSYAPAQSLRDIPLSIQLAPFFCFSADIPGNILTLARVQSTKMLSISARLVTVTKY